MTKVLFLFFILFSNTWAAAREASPIKVDDSLVRFAVIADLTGGERAGVFDVAVEGLAAMQPDFILSIGDLIEGGTEDIVQLNKEWENFDRRIKKTGVPFYPVVGNHDISNLVQRNWWEETVGPRYYHFRHKDILFLMMDTEDYPENRFAELADIRAEGIRVYKNDPKDFPKTDYANLPERKTGEFSDKQIRYFEKVIKQNRDVRWTFVLMHKPAWWASTRPELNQELKHKQHLLPIENALKGQSYTMLCGHVHTYDHSKRLGQDYIQLGTTGGAFTPAENGEYMDHILWVSIKGKQVQYLNLTLQGMRNIKGQIPFTDKQPFADKQPCFAQQECSK